MNKPEDLQPPIELNIAVDTPVPTSPLKITGQLSRYYRGLGVFRPLLAIGISAIIWVRFGFVAWLITVIALILGAVLVISLLSRRSIVADEKSIRYRSMFGKTTEIAYTDVESIKFFLNFVDANAGQATRLGVASKTSDKPITVQSFYWRKEDLESLAVFLEKHTGVKVECYNDFLTYQNIVYYFPKHATYIELHPGKIVLIALPILLVVIFGIALIMTFA